MDTLQKKESIICDDFVSDEEDTKNDDNQVSFTQRAKDFDFKKLFAEFVIKKDMYVFSKESSLEKDYELWEELGRGAYGIVYKAIHKTTGKERAVKQIPKAQIKKNQYKRFINEVTALKQLDHHNVVKLFEVYEENSHVYLVQEICYGGELYDRILDQEYFSEQQAVPYFKQIVQAILYCNKNKICHRDLKPENFMFKTKDKDSKLKLIDFGLSRSYYKTENNLDLLGKLVRMKTYAGTAFFVAPEVIRENYNQSCDMWSAGVILYIMLWGYPPFYGENNNDILKSVLNGEYDYNDEVWDKVSPEAKDLINRCLCPEDQRIRPKEALNHAWLEIADDHSTVSKQHMERLRDFQKAKKLKKAALAYIASRATDEDISEELKIFESLDKNKDGYITLKELREGMADNSNLEEISEILKGVDVDANGAINYTEFIAATMDQHKFFKKVKDAFDVFDRNGDGVIDPEELMEVLENEDVELMKLIIQECDQDDDNKITLEEFIQAVLKKE